MYRWICIDRCGSLKPNASCEELASVVVCKTLHFSDCLPFVIGPRTVRSHAIVVPCCSLINSLNVAFCWLVCGCPVMSLGTTLCKHCRGWDQWRHGFVCPWMSCTINYALMMCSRYSDDTEREITMRMEFCKFTTGPPWSAFTDDVLSWLRKVWNGVWVADAFFCC